MQITETTTSTTPEHDAGQVALIEKAIGQKSFAVLSSVSEAGFPHAAGVLYDSVGTTLYVHTMRSSRKARNVQVNDRVGVVVPVRRLPVGPPFNVQFQGRAAVLEMGDPEIVELVARGDLKKVTAHGELDEPDGCFLRIEPTRVVHSYGIGVPMLDVARDPLHAGARSVVLR